MLDNTQSVICAFGLASAAPRSPYRHLELCGIALNKMAAKDKHSQSSKSESQSGTVVFGHLLWGNTAQFPPDGLSTAPAAAARHLRCQNAR